MTIFDQLEACRDNALLYAEVKRIAPYHRVELWYVLKVLMPGLTVGQAAEAIEAFRQHEGARIRQSCPSFDLLVDAVNHLIELALAEAFALHKCEWNGFLITANNQASGKCRFEIIVNESNSWARTCEPEAEPVVKWITEVTA